MDNKYWVIMFQGNVLDNLLFKTDSEARNYVKMRQPKRTFKEVKENVFICSRYGTMYKIIELTVK